MTTLNHLWTRLGIVACAAVALLHAASLVSAAEPLASWNDGATKSAIIDFVSRTTKEGSSDFVKLSDRIAVFDNDGTLWCEHPMYVEGFYTFDRIKALAPQHPEWKTKQPFAAVLSDDKKALAELNEHAFAELIAVTHAGMTTDEFSVVVKEWLATAKHPRFQRRYTELVYQPMLELLDYLKANEFETFIVSGGGVDFMRVFADQAYGIPPERVVGSSGKTKFEVRDGVPLLLKLPEISSIDDGPGKPINIHLHIGLRPLTAFGNSDGDLQMLQWTSGSPGPRFGLIVHHTDAEREYAYDRDTHVGRLDKALDEAAAQRWTVVDMQRDWKAVFPPAAAKTP